MHDLPAGAFQPPAEVGLLAVEEEALIEATDLIQRRLANDHEGARGPVAGTLAGVLALVELALAEDPSHAGDALDPESFGKHV